MAAAQAQFATYMTPLHKLTVISTILLNFGLSIPVLQAQVAGQMSSGGAIKPLQAIMDIRHYTIALEVDIEKKALAGYTEVDLVLQQPTDTLLLDLVRQFTVTKVSVNKSTTRFSQTGDMLFITKPEGFKAGRNTVKVEYNGMPPVAARPPWQGGFTWTKDIKGFPWVVINCQFEGGKIYFPCKDHPSDEPNEGVDFHITVPRELVVAAPGLLQGVTQRKNNTATYHWKTNYTISNYCILFNVGNYKVVSRDYITIEGNKVPMQFYVLAQDTVYARQVLDIRERDTRILEKYFGEYPWVKEKIGIVQVSNSGMEHQTMISYGDRFRYKKVGGQDCSDNLYHEYAHEWWANKVTNKDWAHMWIQEGIATYAEALAFRELGGEEAYEEVMAGNRVRIKNVKPLVQGEHVNSVDTYSGDLYVKGAFFMHTLRHVIGDSLFFPLLKQLATDPKYTYDNFVTTDDVEQLFMAGTGINLSPLFSLYLRTTQKLEFSVKQVQYNTYQVKLLNPGINIPVSVTTHEGTQRVMISNQPCTVKSTIPPVIDGRGAYFKRIIAE